MTISNEILEKLRVHQREPVKHLVEIFQKHGSAIDTSDCGVGKTYVACAVAKQLNSPTLVIAPKISETQWHAAAAHFGDELDFVGYELLRAGNTPYGNWERPLIGDTGDREYFLCQSCQQKVDLVGDKFRPCYCHPLGIHCVTRRKIDWNRGNFIFNKAVKFLVFDEVHRCGGLDSLNADMLIAAKRQGIKTLALSATAACSPLNMRALGYLLDLHADKLNPSFKTWAGKRGVRYEPMRGLQWRASEEEKLKSMVRIRETILPSRGVRVSVSDIPDFPKVDIQAELYDIEEADKVDKLYEQMADALERLHTRKAGDKCADHPLTAILRARQKIELLKVPVAVELCQDYLEKGYSVALFVDFSQTLDELVQRLDCDCWIDGRQTSAHREGSIGRFQSNACRQIVVNNSAGGIAVSLQDLHGNHPRAGLVFPTHSAVTIRQVFGRLPRDGGKSPSLYRVIFAAKTYEVKMHRALRSKLNNLDSLNDADLTPLNLVLS